VEAKRKRIGTFDLYPASIKILPPWQSQEHQQHRDRGNLKKLKQEKKKLLPRQAESSTLLFKSILIPGF